MESAQAKNQALRDAGAVVPTSYEALEIAIKETFEKLVIESTLNPTPFKIKTEKLFLTKVCSSVVSVAV